MATVQAVELHNIIEASKFEDELKKHGISYVMVYSEGPLYVGIIEKSTPYAVVEVEEGDLAAVRLLYSDTMTSTLDPHAMI